MDNGSTSQAPLVHTLPGSPCPLQKTISWEHFLIGAIAASGMINGAPSVDSHNA